MATMTSAANTGSTEDVVISSIVQDELNRAMKLRPTVEDYSSMAVKGVKSIELPKISAGFSGPATQNPDGETPVASQTVTLDTDTLNLDDWTNLPYKIPDRVSRQNVVNLEAMLAKSAGEKYGEYMDDQIIAELKQASAAAPDHILQMSGAGNAALTLEDISEARKLLNKQNLPQSDRWLVISPAQEKAIIDLDNFRNADKYGDRTALLEGEVGQIYGFRVIVHNGLADAEALAYHKSACAIAVQQDVEFETRRASLELKVTEYSFSLGMGHTVLDSGKRNIFFNSTGL